MTIWGQVALICILLLHIAISIWAHYRIRAMHRQALQDRYKAGLAEGSRVATEEAIRQAIEAERLALRRKLTDSGRRSVARPDAPAARIHKAKIAPAPPVNKDKRH